MNIDQRIKQELDRENEKLDAILGKEEGLFDMVITAYKGNLRGWMLVVAAFTLVVTGLLVWSAYRFFTASDADMVYWGFVLLLSLIAQVAMKQWSWMEMQRTSILREIKRVEYSVAQLTHALEEHRDAKS